MIKDTEYIIRIFSIIVHFHVFFEFIHLFFLICHIFFDSHWICFLLLMKCMLNLYTMFGIALITCIPFSSCALNTLQLLLLWENCWYLSELTVHMDGILELILEGPFQLSISCGTVILTSHDHPPLERMM